MIAPYGRVLQFVPQECTHETSGLLYFDLLTSKMFRCTGQQWQEWGWGSSGDGLQYTALLRDSAADQPSPPAADAGPHPSEDEDDDDDDDVITVTSGRQQTGRGRRKACRQG